ncbi:MAG: Gfo/Idh/MocA family oxidoreductase [bacterium]
MMTNRRCFLKGAAVAGMPFILPSHIWGAEVKPNSRLNVGMVGVGGHGHALMKAFMYNASKVIAICDVDAEHCARAKQTLDDFYAADPKRGAIKPKVYGDYRELMADRDIDIVAVATPDHWHALVTLAALKAGKDVYCEKPLTHNIHEAVQVMRAVEANKRVLQTGSMQRSWTEFRVACELVRNGIIGKISRVECAFGGAPKPYDLPEEPMKPGLNWDMWCGPEKVVPYNSKLAPGNWRAYREFGGGGVCDFGAHHLDIAQWGLDMDETGPVEVTPPEKASDALGCQIIYANGIPLIHKAGFGISFYGENGVVQVNRGTFEFILNGKTEARFVKGVTDTSCETQVALTARNFLKDAKCRLPVSKNHVVNFLDCVTTREKPIAHARIGAHTAICCHLLNQCYYHRQKMLWDPKVYAFREGTGDSAWLTRDYRAPFKV